MNVSTIVIAFLSISGLLFFAGMEWSNYKFSKMAAFQLNKAIELQSGPGDIGSLPSKTNLYLYRSLPEINLYVVFVAVDLGGVDMTKREGLGRAGMSSISGYSAD